MKLRIWQIVFATLALVALSLVFVWPFVWMLSTSLKVDEKIQSAPTEVIPRAPFVMVDGKAALVKRVKEHDGKTDVLVMEGNQVTEKVLTVDPAEIQERPYLNWANYSDALQSFPFVRYLLNTLTICVIAVIGTMLSCSNVTASVGQVRFFSFTFCPRSMKLP